MIGTGQVHAFRTDRRPWCGMHIGKGEPVTQALYSDLCKPCLKEVRALCRRPT